MEVLIPLALGIAIGVIVLIVKINKQMSEDKKNAERHYKKTIEHSQRGKSNG